MGIELLVQSVGHSGWNKVDYYNTAVKTYFSSKPDLDMEKIESKDDLQFKFKEEWEILKDHENGKQPCQKKRRKKRKSGGSISTEEKLGTRTDSNPIVFHPSSQKKAKLVQSLTECTDSFLLELRQQQKKGMKKGKWLWRK